jgi:cyclopropane fatty-acyl-phospholipid synthase-like methyltransferase
MTGTPIRCRIIATNATSVTFFPGGMLPSPQVLKSLGERFGVPVIRERIFGQDYAKHSQSGEAVSARHDQT